VEDSLGSFGPVYLDRKTQPQWLLSFPGTLSRIGRHQRDLDLHYYQFHIGDYLKDTRHLTNEEDLAYRRLLDLYYDSEAFIPLETQSVSRRLQVGCEALITVLNEFFIKTETGYQNLRADQVIAEYHATCERNKANGKLGGRPKKTQSVSSGNPVESQPETISHNPITNNQGKTSSSGNNPDKPKKKFGNEEDHQAARWIFERVQQVNPTAKEPNWDAWANDIRLMREQDRRDHRGICELFGWANKDSFWKANILSPDTLRKQWDKLTAKRGTNGSHVKSFADTDYGSTGAL
jgi:uncharacterized protein YdaU (DUF1376 family)